MLPDRLQAVALRKVYPGTVALADVSLRFAAGEVHALIGKNGAGKSTLVKIFSGAVQPTSGQILVDGRPIRLRSPREAFSQGIATVYQELSLVPALSVGENILFGRWPKRRRWGRWIIDWAEVFRSAQAVLQRIGVALDVRAKVGRLGMARQQLVEIAKAMSFHPSVLILDEPTSALAQHEVGRLLSLVRGLAQQGTAVIYISHRLQELPQVADKVSALRDGSCAGTIPIAQATPPRMVEMMFGGAVAGRRSEPPAVPGPPLLEGRNLSRRGKLDDVSFTLHGGEVLGIAGMLGSGRTELLMSIFGAEPLDRGQVLVAGREVRHPRPATMKRLGVGLVPEDRKQQSLVGRWSVRDNLCLAALRRIALGGLIWKGRQNRVVRELVGRLRIALSSAEQPVASLSGGNQQKVVIGKWLATQPRVMLFDEPTRGIDLQTKQQVFAIIRDLSRQGIGSLFVSSELEELLEVCHRILVLRGGRLVGQFTAGGVQLDELFAACMGSD